MVLTSPITASFLLAHTGHDHSDGTSEAQSSQAFDQKALEDAPHNLPPSPGKNSSSASSSESPITFSETSSEVASEYQSPEAGFSPEGVKARPSAASESTSQTGTSEVPVESTNQAEILGTFGSEALFALILAGPMVLRQLRRWI